MGRSNQNYEIIESTTIGNTEYVLGHNPLAPNPYVTWCCKNGTDYYWGNYFNNEKCAKEDLHSRAKKEQNYLESIGKIPPSPRKRGSDYER